jgi:hypothetical protein
MGEPASQPRVSARGQGVVSVAASTSLTPAERRLRAQAAAHARWAQEDPIANAARGQAGLLARFEREVDPDGTLPPAERARRAESARKAHMARLAFASSKARRAKSAGPAPTGGAAA